MIFLEQSYGYQKLLLEDLTTPGDADAINRKWNTGVHFTASNRLLEYRFKQEITVNYIWAHHQGLNQIEVFNDRAEQMLDTTQRQSPLQGNYILEKTQIGTENTTNLRIRGRRAGTATEAYIYEVQFFKERFTLNNSNERPMDLFHFDDAPGEQKYRVRDSTLISYAGLSERGKRTLFIRWEFMDKEFIDQLMKIWRGPPLKKPFVLIPVETEKEEIYELYWLSKPRVRLSGTSLISGYTIDGYFEEV